MLRKWTKNEKKILGGVKFVVKTDTEFVIQYKTGEKAKLNILNNHVFKYFMSPSGMFPDYPEPQDPDNSAKIIVKEVSDYGIKAFEQTSLKEGKGKDHSFILETDKIKINLDKTNGMMTVVDKRTNKKVIDEAKPLSYSDYKSVQILHQTDDEQFFGGGMQNGRFTHKGEVIDIANTNDWTDGGVTSPCPYYWSSNGYGVMRNTWQPGIYDFGSCSAKIIKTIHEEGDFDAYFFINPLPKDILNDYYELTGKPIFMPEYSFYEAHLNAFNRDYWVKVDPDVQGAILFEDGEYYKCYKPNEMEDKVGILESLNGEKNNYQFSARAMVDRYKRHDVPLGWFVPNDGYGSGYGQTDSLKGDINNLKEFADYARDNGVEVALWTESQLEPEDHENPVKGERDLQKEVGLAGVVALKCDVAWIGQGYSFGLNAIEKAANIFVKGTKQRHRPLIIMVNGWAGTQRYSGIWSGDQTGGLWENIRFHIPTYIGTGLAGQPLVGSDMDGIYGGESREVNIRDYQWKTFTPLQLNMDGWGDSQKTPFGFDDEATAINRAYLKLKSTLMPYNYTIGYESTHGLPMIRAMFLEFPDEPLAYTIDSQYQFMWGPSILVAPIYNAKGDLDASIRDGIYLPKPDQVWIDLFTGEKYQGGKVLNNIRAPLWKIPVFVKDGAIIPMVNPNNNPSEIQRDNRIFNIYPNGETSFEVYEDDGITSDYLKGDFAKTEVRVIGPSSNEFGDLFITINKTEGTYVKMKKERTTLLRVMASKDVDHIKAAINGNPIDLTKVKTDEDFDSKDNVFFFKQDYLLNPYLNADSDVCKQKFLLLKFQKADVTSSVIQIKIKEYKNESKVFGSNTMINNNLDVPKNLIAFKRSGSVTLKWEQVGKAIYYEVERDGAIFSNISRSKGSSCRFHGFKDKTLHAFRVRSVNNEGVSEWSEFVMVEFDIIKNIVHGVVATCNINCEPGETICNLTDGNKKTLWHTDWNLPGLADPATGGFITLNFDLGDVYELKKMTYLPREDAGNGTILKMKYRYSVDGKKWTQWSEEVEWKCDNTVKSVALNGEKMKFVEWKVLEGVSGFGSGRQVLFYIMNKKNKKKIQKKICYFI